MHRVLLFILLLGVASAQAYEPPTLQGLAEQAALSPDARLHRRLMDRFGLSLGLFEPLTLRFDHLPDEAAHSLKRRLRGMEAVPLRKIERAQPLVDHEMRRHPALYWLGIGSALEAVPAWRMRNHFLHGGTQPGMQKGSGLMRPAGQAAAQAVLASVWSRLSTLNQVMTGTAFDGTGMPSTEWLRARDNDLSIPALHEALAQAVVAAAPETREGALVRALLAAGGILGVLARAGDPAYVRNDLEAALQIAGYERFVSERYGRAGVPPPLAKLPHEGPIARFEDLLIDPKGAGSGLAERTARRFFSSATLPGVEPGSGGRGAGTSAPARWPARPSGYLSTREVPHLSVWRRVDGSGGHGRLVFSLDERCYADYAQVLLPEIGRYAVLGLRHLLRGELKLEREGDMLQMTTREVGLGPGTLTVVSEGSDGRRRVLAQHALGPLAMGQRHTLGTFPQDGARRLAVLYRGVDEQGVELVLSGQTSLGP